MSSSAVSAQNTSRCRKSTSRKRARCSIAAIQEELDRREAAKVTIDPQGDVTLAMSQESSPLESKEIRVSSRVLCLASDVFTVLFSPRFREGQELLEGATSGTPVRINIHDDDPDGMTLLCRLLHHKYELDAEPLPTVLELEQLAILTDKYNCAELLIIRHATNHWLMKMARVTVVPKYGDLLALSYHFKSHATFRFLTKNLFLKSCRPFVEITQSVTLQSIELPMYVIAHLSVRKDIARRKLARGLDKISGHLAGVEKDRFGRGRSMSPVEEVCRGRMLRAFTVRLASTEIRDFCNNVTSDLDWTLLQMEQLFVCAPIDYPCKTDGCACTQKRVEHQIRNLAIGMRDFVYGLCVDSVASEEQSSACIECYAKFPPGLRDEISGVAS